MRTFHREHRVETAEGGSPGSGNHEADLSAPAAPFVRHPLARARNRHQDSERAYGRHNNIKTTERYVHIADTFKSNIKSPLDDLLMEEDEV